MEESAQASHWRKVWERSVPERVSWYQIRPDTSLALLETAGIGHSDGIVDVGGGASNLVDHLLETGFKDVAVLDISPAALHRARTRLGEAGKKVEWIEADLVRFVPGRTWDVWHDRAVFHFLTEADDRAAYRETLVRSLAVGGHAILATFGPDGPTRCSGLDTCRYSAEGLRGELGPGFRLEETRLKIHRTPAGSEQQFLYVLLQRSA